MLCPMSLPNFIYARTHHQRWRFPESAEHSILASPRAPMPARAYGRTRLTMATSAISRRGDGPTTGRVCRWLRKNCQAVLCAFFVSFVRFVVWPVADRL